MKRITNLVLVLASCMFIFSCNKEGKGGEETGTAQLGVEVKNAQEIYEVPQNQTITLDVMAVADPVSAEAYTISLSANPALVSSYNSEHGTSYQMLPSDAYQFTSSNVMLPRYSAKSTTCELKLKGAGCDLGKTYLLPVAIDAVMGGVNFKAPNDKAAYILFKMKEPEQEGSGTSADPYIINDAKAFMNINNMLKEDSSVYFKMNQDIDFSGVVFTEENPWTPINYAVDDDAVPAAEKRLIYFDGNNYKISGFTGGGALFGTLVGCIHDLTIENANIVCLVGNAGGVLIGNAGTEATKADVIVKNVIVRNSSIENDYKRTGGLIGWLKGGVVENSSADCTIVGSQQVAGLVGRMEEGALLNCSANGSVTLNPYYGGGLVGFMSSGTLRNCHASVDVAHSGNNYTRSGGLVGQVDGQAVIEKCYATGNVVGTGHFGGALVGVVGAEGANVRISKCYSTGNVTLPITGNFAHGGGILGSVCAAATATIDNCYSTGNIVVRRYSSGCVGTAGHASAKLTVTNCYTTSDLSGINAQTLCGVVLGNITEGATVSYSGVIGWNDSPLPFGFPADKLPVAGNYLGKEGTVSKQAQTLGWSTEIWDLSGDLPKLK